MMVRHILHSGRFEFEAGGCLPSVDLCYYTPDREYRPGERVVWICHALTGNANPEDWWPEMVGDGKFFDTSACYVVCASMLCSSYGECGPSSTNPATGKPWLMDFPETTVRDMVRAEIRVRKALGIDRVDMLIGPSIGGFQAVEWCVMEPDVIGSAVFLATDVCATPFLTAFNESQRMALVADSTFLSAESLSGGREGLKCARSIALISYRTFEGYNLTQGEEEDFLFAERAGSYQRYQGEKLVKRGFDAYSYWYLTKALDSMNVGRGRGGIRTALSSVRAKCFVISVKGDMLFPPERGKLTAEMLGVPYFEIDSSFGHDGFLIEKDQLTAILEKITAL